MTWPLFTTVANSALGGGSYRVAVNPATVTWLAETRRGVTEIHFSDRPEPRQSLTVDGALEEVAAKLRSRLTK